MDSGESRISAPIGRPYRGGGTIVSAETGGDVSRWCRLADQDDDTGQGGALDPALGLGGSGLCLGRHGTGQPRIFGLQHGAEGRELQGRMRCFGPLSRGA